MPTSARRFLVLGLDGGTFDLLDPLMEAGDLPFLQALARGGVKAPLALGLPGEDDPGLVLVRDRQGPGRARDLRLHRAGRRARALPTGPLVPAQRGVLGPALAARPTRSAS